MPHTCTDPLTGISPDDDRARDTFLFHASNIARIIAEAPGSLSHHQLHERVDLYTASVLKLSTPAPKAE